MPAFWRLVDTPVGHAVLAVDDCGWVTVEFAALHDDHSTALRAWLRQGFVIDEEGTGRVVGAAVERAP